MDMEVQQAALKHMHLKLAANQSVMKCRIPASCIAFFFSQTGLFRYQSTPVTATYC